MMLIVISMAERPESGRQAKCPAKTYGVRSQAEVARIMTDRGYPMCPGRVGQIERRALKKLATDTAVLDIALELGFFDQSEGTPLGVA